MLVDLYNDLSKHCEKVYVESFKEVHIYSRDTSGVAVTGIFIEASARSISGGYLSRRHTDRCSEVPGHAVTTTSTAAGAISRGAIGILGFNGAVRMPS